VNADNQGFAGLSTDEVTRTFISAVKQDIAKKQKKGMPVARYDVETGRAYLENADGTREYV
jgi:hypothetical protein